VPNAHDDGDGKIKTGKQKGFTAETRKRGEGTAKKEFFTAETQRRRESMKETNRTSGTEKAKKQRVKPKDDGKIFWF
jgi:beta-lactamase class A